MARPVETVRSTAYTRDGFTGSDYAEQRFYASVYGRFGTADPYQASAGPSDPGSWNRYAYVGGDPVGRMDRSGLDWCLSDIVDSTVEGVHSSTDNYSYCPGGEEDDIAFQAGRGPTQSSAIQWRARVQSAIAKATAKALKALDKPECAQLFGFDSLDAEAIFSSLMRNSTMIGPIKSPAGTTISATTQGTTLVTANGTFNGTEITINDLAGKFVTGGLDDQVVTLLHERGHAVNCIYGDGTSKIVKDGTALGQAGIKASMDNTALVKQNCLPVK